tara:strand:+ start:278 stop:457 length:180 start_codon:yes stop_codon:yes gene_type:complete
MDLVWELMMEIDGRDKGLAMELIFSQRLTTPCHCLRTSVQKNGCIKAAAEAVFFIPARS